MTENQSQSQSHEQAYFVSVGVTYNKELAVKENIDILNLPTFSVVNIMATGDIVPLTVESITGLQSKVFAKVVDDVDIDKETISQLITSNIVTISIMGILPALVPSIELDDNIEGQTMQ